MAHLRVRPIYFVRKSNLHSFDADISVHPAGAQLYLKNQPQRRKSSGVLALEFRTGFVRFILSGHIFRHCHDCRHVGTITGANPIVSDSLTL